MSNVTDYVGRKVDLLAFQGGIADNRDHLLGQTLVPDGGAGAIVAGIEKLAQRFLLVWLTAKGSMVYQPTFGTQFMLDATKGFWRTAADVRQSFFASMLDTRRQLVTLELTTDPTDERFGSVDLLNISLTGAKVTITLMLNSLAGTSRQFIIPLTVPIK